MALVPTISTPMRVFSSSVLPQRVVSEPRRCCCLPGKPGNPLVVSPTGIPSSLFSSESRSLAKNRHGKARYPPLKASSSSLSSVGSAEFVEEPGTKVKFSKSLSTPDCSRPLTLLGTGYREKVFAIFGVKVYAAALYVDESILKALSDRKGHPGTAIQNDPSLFDSIFRASSDKLLQITLVRDVDGKTFWDALDEALSPRIQSPSADDKAALSIFRGIFQGKPLNKGTRIFMTWPDPSQLLVSITSGGLPSTTATKIESANVSSAMFDVFFGQSTVSPSLKTSVANQLAKLLK